MRKDIERTLSVAGAVFSAAMFVWAFAAYPPKGSTEWASWVQAIGSIAAIGAAAWVVQRQHNLEKARTAEAELRSRLSLHNAAFQLVGGVYRKAESVRDLACDEYRQVEFLRPLGSDLAGLVMALGKVNHLRFETHAAIEAILVAESVGREFQNFVYEARVYMEKGPHSQWIPLCERANAVLKEIKPRMDVVYAEIHALERQLQGATVESEAVAQRPR
ncbi:hypothetical protein AB4142_24040 [Variovorax sp. 2RAF20]